MVLCIIIIVVVLLAIAVIIVVLALASTTTVIGLLARVIVLLIFLPESAATHISIVFLVFVSVLRPVPHIASIIRLLLVKGCQIAGPELVH